MFCAITVVDGEVGIGATGNDMINEERGVEEKKVDGEGEGLNDEAVQY